MISILILTIIVTALLFFSHIISYIQALVLLISCLLALVIISIRTIRRNLQLKQRIKQCQAEWGSKVIHLGGLPLPLETQGLVLLTNSELIFESDHLTQHYHLSSLVAASLLSAEQIKNLPDASICAIMGSKNCHSLTTAREIIRRSGNNLKNNPVLLLHYQEKWQTSQVMSLIILTLEQKAAQTELLWKNEDLKRILRSYRPVKHKLGLLSSKKIDHN